MHMLTIPYKNLSLILYNIYNGFIMCCGVIFLYQNNLIFMILFI